MSAYSVNEVIEMAVQIERNGYAFYNEATKRKDLDTKSREFLTMLRDQELNHEKIFLALRDDSDLKMLELSQDWEMVGMYLKTITDARIFNTPEAAIKLATNAMKVMDIVDYAIGFEKDTLLYFHAIKDVVNSPKAQLAIAKIIHEEITHVLRLTEFKAQLG
jgi:rubrerythrin